jgi:serine/threonine-protein kinase
VTATSPVTGDTYTMQCSGESPVSCSGGNNAFVVFYS